MARRDRRVRDLRTDWLTVAAVVAFVLFDVALVWFALSSVRSAAAGAVQTREILPTVDAELAPGASAAPTMAPPTAAPALMVAAPTRAFAAIDGDIAYRAAAGECGVAPAQVERTGDGGETWSSTTPAEVTAVQQILTDGSDDVAIVAVEPDGCSPVLVRSYSQGAEWVQTTEVSAHWHLGAGRVVAPGGAASTPCAAPLQIAPRDEASAAVLCSDTTVAATSDGGATWFSSAALAGATSIARSEDAYRVAVVGMNGCEGAQVVSLTAALETGTPGECVVTEADLGSTVLATAADGTVWIWAGDALARSSDGGLTW